MYKRKHLLILMPLDSELLEESYRYVPEEAHHHIQMTECSLVPKGQKKPKRDSIDTTCVGDGLLTVLHCIVSLSTSARRRWICKIVWHIIDIVTPQ